MSFHFSISTKGLILVSLPLFFQLLFICVVTGLHWKNMAIEELASHSKEVGSQAVALLESMADAETGVRGLILADDDAFLEPYNRAVVDAPAQARRLRELVRDNQEQTERAAQIEESVAETLAWLTESKQLALSGRRQEAIAREKTKEGKQRMDILRREMAVFLAKEDEIQQQRERELRGSQRSMRSVVMAGGAATAALAIALGFIFNRGIGHRFAILMDNTKRLAAGKTLVPPVSGSDEIAQLDAVFHEMAAALIEAADHERLYIESLEQRVEERMAELTAVNRDLAHKNQENETFVYSVSHDLRSPLVNLQGFSNELGMAADRLRALLLEPQLPETARRRGLAIVDGDIAESVHFIRTGVMRLSNIIDALLRLSRAGRVDYLWCQVDVQAIVERVAESMKGTAEQRGATLTIDALPPVWGDATALEQVFANLIGNALNYLDPARPGRIEVGCAAAEEEDADDDCVIYFVRDNGLGIAEPQVPKIFQAFQRLHPEAAAGEGMGLTIVRRVVERHHGQIWVESSVGAGSTFFVSLPTLPVAVSREMFTEAASTF